MCAIISHMVYCSNCGEEIGSKSRVCPECETEVPGVDEDPFDESSESESDTGGAFDSLSTEEKVGLGGSGLTIVGAFLPWATVFGTSIAGIQGDGVLTLLGGIIAAVLIWWRPWERNTQIGTAVIGVLTVLIGFSAMTSVAGIGVYLTLVGGVAMAYSGGQPLVE